MQSLKIRMTLTTLALFLISLWSLSFYTSQMLLERPLLHSLFNGGVIAYRLDGTAIAEVPPSAGRIGVNDMDLDTLAATLKDGQATIGKPVMGKKLLAPVFGMTVPIRDAGGAIVGALSGVIDGMPVRPQP